MLGTAENKDEFISDVPLWIYWLSRYGQLAKTNTYQLCTDTECHLEDSLKVMDGERESKESVLLTSWWD